MNLFYNSLRIFFYYHQSPLLINNNNLNVFKSNFYYFFSGLIYQKQFSNFHLNQCNLKYFLNRSISLINSFQYGYFTKQRITFTTEDDTQIIDCIFYDCKSSLRGGALYLSDVSKYLLIFRTGFYYCRSTKSYDYSGGAISVFGANKVSILEVCFYNCSNTNDPPSFQLPTHGEGGITQTDFNYTIENFGGKNDLISDWGSMVSGTILLFSNNNFSNGYGGRGTYGGALMFPNSDNSIYGIYSQISNMDHEGFIGFYSGSGNKYFNYWNFFNNSLFSNSWIYKISSSVTPYFRYCSFYFNTDCSPGSSPTFENCIISHLSISNRIGTFINCTYEFAEFNTQKIINQISNKCWNRGYNQTIFLSTIFNNYFNMNLFGNLFFILLNF